MFSSKVDQTPAIVWSPESPAEITCHHQITSYDTLQWYQRSQTDTELKLIGYVYYEQITIEKPFEKHFNVSGHGKTHSTLHLIQLRKSEDSAVYYCAAYYHSAVSSLSIKQKPIFNNLITEKSFAQLSHDLLYDISFSSFLITTFPHRINRTRTLKINIFSLLGAQMFTDCVS